MNSWKNLFFLAILAAVGCGLYMSLMHNNTPGPPPPGAENASVADVKVEPGEAVTAPSSPTAGQTAQTAPVEPPPPGVASPAAPALPATGVPATLVSESSPPPGSSAPGSVPPPPPDAETAPPPAAVMAPVGLAAAPPAAAADKAADARDKVKKLLATVSAEVNHGQMADAHRLLSSLYGSPEVPSDMTREINSWLDQMAGMVIYSRQHLLERPYVVQSGDTLERIGEKYSVPGTLLARINGIRDPQSLRPGRELKVVRGPFSALISLEKMELTLMLQDRYAGRFAIGLGTDHRPMEGNYTVREKVLNPGYGGYSGGSFAIQPGDPKNPLGKFWIGLGDQIGIHGTTNLGGIGRTDNPGSICLSQRDIDDVYGILSVGSKVVIQRRRASGATAGLSSSAAGGGGSTLLDKPAVAPRPTPSAGFR